MSSYWIINTEKVEKAKRNRRGIRMTSNGTPVFNDGEHHVIDLSGDGEKLKDKGTTIVVLLPNGNAMTLALMGGEMRTICDISVTTGERKADTQVVGIDDDKKNESLENFGIYSIEIDSKIKLHHFDPTDSSGHSMTCLHCNKVISSDNPDDWDRAFREECKMEK